MTTELHADPHAAPVRARIVLPGHRDVHASVDVLPTTTGARIARTLLLAALWGGLTAATFFVTIFDPFMTSMPLFVGAVMTYKSWRGRYKVTEFRGACPRCAEPIKLKTGSKIGTPHHMVCYNCHHEPDLYLAA